MDTFEDVLVKTISVIYRDIEAEYVKKGIKYTQAEIYEQACGVLGKALTEADSDAEWEISLKYESMRDLYDKNT